MYLNAKRFLHYDEEPLKKRVAKVLPDAPGEPKEVTVEVIYWRKANRIHAWFVKNVQGSKASLRRKSQCRRNPPLNYNV
jgi:hypothetical protein